MPFHNTAAHCFSAVSVQRNAPALSGVYGICNNREWLFIGVADDIQAALLQHLRETGSLLQLRMPSGFAFEVCSPAERVVRQNRLIVEMKPACNRGAR